MVGLVYGLIASDEPEVVRYIGITTQSLEIRLRGHFHNLHRRNDNRMMGRRDHRKSDWIQAVLARGAEVRIVKLAEHDNDGDLFECEHGLIIKHKDTLLNLRGLTLAYRRDGGKRKTALAA